MAPPYTATLEYLNKVLQARGPQALPYAEAVKWNIREHLVELQKGAKYNIPVVFWLAERYPYDAPLVYVVPTPTMVIKPGHSFVDRSGQVSTPKIKSWLFPSSNLVEVALEMSQVFGTDPPLYSQPAGPVPTSSYTRPPPTSSYARPPPVQPPTGYPPPSFSQSTYSSQPPSAYPLPYSSNPSASSFTEVSNPAANPLWGAAFQAAQQASSSASSSNISGSHALNPVSSYTPAAEPSKPPPPPAPRKEDLEASFRPLALDALRSQLKAAEKSYQEHCVLATDSLLDVQRKLAERKAQLTGMVTSLKQERMSTEGVVKEMHHKTQQLQQWLDQNESKAAAVDLSTLDINNVILPADELSKQSLETHAQDLAIEDTVLALDKALQAGMEGLTVDVYLKQVRALCRRQFFARALGLKVAEVQRQQPQQPAAAESMQPYPVAHGDSWTSSSIPSYPSLHSAPTNSGMLQNPLGAAW